MPPGGLVPSTRWPSLRLEGRGPFHKGLDEARLRGETREIYREVAGGMAQREHGALPEGRGRARSVGVPTRADPPGRRDWAACDLVGTSCQCM